jgi:hypothetical protein
MSENLDLEGSNVLINELNQMVGQDTLTYISAWRVTSIYVCHWTNSVSLLIALHVLAMWAGELCLRFESW